MSVESSNIHLNKHSTPPPIPQQANNQPTEYHREPFYSTKGRIGRIRFFAYGLLMSFCLLTPLIMIFMIIFGITVAIYGLESNATIVIGVIAFIAYMILAIYISFVPMIRRLNDLNQSGWLSLLALLPIVNIFFYFYLLFARGDEGVNQYGVPAEPPSTGLKVFIILFTSMYLLSLVGLIVFVIVAEDAGYLDEPYQDGINYEEMM